MHRRCALAALLLLLPAACSSGLGNLPPIEGSGPAVYRLGPGDELRLAVFGFDQMTNSYTVSDDGTISLPLLSSVKADGKTPPELESTIAGILRDRQLAPNASVSVQVQKYRPIYILGEVQKPGQYPYVPGMTVTTAVAIAGGYTFRANQKVAAVNRGSGTKASQRQAGPDATILPGDTIRVPEAWF
jgi:protein involved in polysaccharide export with SLBB domain